MEKANFYAPDSVPPDLAEANRRGLHFHQEKRFDRSLEQFWLSLMRSREMGYRDWEAVSLNNIGMVYQTWGKYDHAMKFFQRSLVLSDEIGFAQGAVVALNNLGRLYESWNRLDRALEYYEKGYALAEANGDLNTRRTTLMNMAMCLEKRGEFPRCRQLVQEVVQIDHLLQHPNTQVDKVYLESLQERP